MGSEKYYSVLFKTKYLFVKPCIMRIFLMHKFNKILFLLHHILLKINLILLFSISRRLTSWLLPFEPFQVTLWLGLSGCLFLEFLALMFTRKLGKEDIEEHSWKSSMEFSFISTLKLLISQGTSYIIKSTSLRIIMFSCYIIDIIITSVYSGGLASILTIPAFGEPPDTKERLVKQNFIWGATSYAWIASLANTKDEVMLKIKDLFRIYTVKELVEKSLAGEIGVALERLTWGHFAFYKFIDQEIVDKMKLMTEDLYYAYVVAFTPRPWALLEKFNLCILLIQSSGISKHWEWKVVNDHLDEKLQRQIEDSAWANFGDGGAVQLGLTNFAGIIVLWIAGIIFSVLVFAVEIISNRKLKPNENLTI
ncbi:uncharacterized protein LOC129942791 [Eupeodes corollae]|uniref:uncharacterized protein LOC129942791 n=1 Tax=Eupeodes corollae TaxID=290404 RepID=UPI002492E7BB|nr:uncharacterized protein LOC129942791 [Eupeodes corollae]